jgi:hypothetical protein
MDGKRTNAMPLFCQNRWVPYYRYQWKWQMHSNFNLPKPMVPLYGHHLKWQIPSLKELPSLRRKGGEASKKHNVLFAAGVGFYNPIIILPPVSLYKTPACVLQKLVLRTRICKHIAPPEGEMGKEGKCQFQGVLYREPS